ncbi:MAG: AraC family transcriptional regulator [Pseudomonadales bacterium]|nr:AraC family transcriptional regulator [Pseudomonadales bacterium]
MEEQSIFYVSEKRCVVIGQTDRCLNKKKATACLTISLDDELSVQLENGSSLRAKSFLVPSGTSISLNTNGARVAQYFLDEQGADFARISPFMRDAQFINGESTIYSDLVYEEYLATLSDFYLMQQPTVDVGLQLFENWLLKLPLSGTYKCDLRVQLVLATIKEHYKENIAMEDITEKVGLSVPRLSQLFKESTGLPIRRVRLWYRVLAATDKINQGYPLTEAALDSGFSDYAHMSRVFKELIGVKPSTIKGMVLN